MFPAELVLKAVPQRYPFLMIDRILEQDFRRRAVCQKNVTQGEEILTGHFPGNPIYPGVMMIEMGLQTTQVMLTNLENLSVAPAGGAEQGYMVMVDKFKFNRIVRPGDILRITSELHNEVMGLLQAKIKIETNEGENVASGIVTVKGAS